MTIPDEPNQKAIDSASARILRGQLDISDFQEAVRRPDMPNTCKVCGTIYGVRMICHVCNPGGGDTPIDCPLKPGDRVLVMHRWEPVPGERYLRAEGYATLVEKAPLKPNITPDIESWFVQFDGSDERVLRSVYARDRVTASPRPASVAAPRAINAQLLEALREIAKGEGRFSRDPLTHASNTIEDMKAIAEAAIRAAEQDA